MNLSPYIGRNCRITSGGMEHVCHIEEHGAHQVELIGLGYAEPYHVATLGNAIMEERATVGDIVIIGSSRDVRVQ